LVQYQTSDGRDTLQTSPRLQAVLSHSAVKSDCTWICQTEMVDPDTRDITRVVLAVLAIGGLIATSGWILRPFATAGVWAIMITVASWPLLLRLQRRFRGQRTPAGDRDGQRIDPGPGFTDCACRSAPFKSTQLISAGGHRRSRR
jgi:hypothetical protein